MERWHKRKQMTIRGTILLKEAGQKTNASTDGLTQSSWSRPVLRRNVFICIFTLELQFSPDCSAQVKNNFVYKNKPLRSSHTWYSYCDMYMFGFSGMQPALRILMLFHIKKHKNKKNLHYLEELEQWTINARQVHGNNYWPCGKTLIKILNKCLDKCI